MEEGRQDVLSDGVGDEMKVERVPPVDTQSKNLMGSTLHSTVRH